MDWRVFSEGQDLYGGRRSHLDMLRWLSRFFGFGNTSTVDTPVVAPPALDRVAVGRAAHPPAADTAIPKLRGDDAEFLSGFLAPTEIRPLDELPADDRLFLGGIRSRWHERKLELPVLPEAAIKLRTLLQKGDAAISKYAELLEQDSALSVEVLTAANSAAYGGGAAVHSVHDAIVRIGVQRLEGILLVSQLRSRVLKAGALQRVGEVLVELAGPLSQVASARAARRGNDTHAAFTRGTLWHVEHLVIVGAVSEISREHQRVLQPSRRALHQAFAQFGPDIRQAVAKAWRLEDLLLGSDDADALRLEYAAFRQAIVCRWLGREVLPVDGTDLSELEDALKDVPLRAA